MLMRIVMALLFAAVVAPREPDLGLGQPSLFSQVPMLSNLQALALQKLSQVRADLKANGAHV